MTRHAAYPKFLLTDRPFQSRRRPGQGQYQPNIVFARRRIDGHAVVLVRGEKGYRLIGPEYDIDLLNKLLGVTPKLIREFMKASGVE